jgi:hypothetical protein
MNTTATARAFFYEHAGYSYNPKTETRAEGRRRCAAALAQAEAQGSDAGLSFQWQIDEAVDSSDFSNERPPWQLWACCCRDAEGAIKANLCGIDFGRDGQPWGEPYRRVVEAELASEALHAMPATNATS